MKYLLDSNVLIWWNQDKPFKESAYQLIQDPNNDIYISSISLYEILLKVSIGKLDFPKRLDISMGLLDMNELPFNMKHASGIADMPHHHKDPFDRMLIAQAMEENMAIITADRVFHRYNVRIIDA